jgi:3-hydroxyacyl-CoA dehydrogenase/enoyl-CoA hydratase/3-hydroxybutyryl-CoA epimerase
VALDMAGLDIVGKLVALGRTGKAKGQGFYDWDTRTIWSGLSDLIDATPEETGLEHLQRRLMVAQAAEVGRVLDDGIIRDHLDVEVGAIFGLGYAPNTGGPLAWMDRQGLRPLVSEMRTFAKKYGERYAPAPILVEMAEKGQSFWGDFQP